MMKKSIVTFISGVFLLSCHSNESKKEENAGKQDEVTTPSQQEVNLPAPYDTKSNVNYPEVTGWPAGKTPIAPEGVYSKQVC